MTTRITHALSQDALRLRHRERIAIGLQKDFSVIFWTAFSCLLVIICSSSDRVTSMESNSFPILTEILSDFPLCHTLRKDAYSLNGSSISDRPVSLEEMTPNRSSSNFWVNSFRALTQRQYSGERTFTRCKLMVAVLATKVAVCSIEEPELTPRKI